MVGKKSKLTLNQFVFFPPLILLLITLGVGIFRPDYFLELLNTANDWILDHFDWLFSWSSFIFLFILAFAYFSPFGRIKIGGPSAEPILTKSRWFAITLCTTIATGILFWGMAEPLYHLHTPPAGLSLEPNSAQAITFSLSTLFMHWSFTPYGVYTLTALVFAITYYNLKQPFSLTSIVYPVFGSVVHRGMGKVIDMICLFALVAGMSASLGAGIFAIMGGIESLSGIEQSSFILGMIGFLIVLSFILSAATGLNNGIRILSNINTRAFFALALFVLIAGPTVWIFESGATAIVDYVVNFLPRSTNISSGLSTEWLQDWTVFYLANWFAWAPIAALFLGRIAVGYTVREFIRFNLIYPSCFAVLWMCIFGGASLYQDINSSGGL